MRALSPIVFVLLAVGCRRPATVREQASFVTTLGRDTVAIESFTRTASHLEGNIVVRVPGTVLCHYALDLTNGGDVSHAALDVTPIGATVPERHVSLDFTGDSLRVDVDAAGRHIISRQPLDAGAYPQYMTGFGSSYGLYSSLGIYEVLLAHLGAHFDSVSIPSVDMASGRAVEREFVRRSPARVDADYFGIAWTHLTLDDSGRIVSADASETTEKTQSRRTPYIDARQAAQRFAAADRAGHGLGVASPSAMATWSVGGQPVVVVYSSPRRRNRAILGAVVPYDQVWRTGANAATTLTSGRALRIGGVSVPAGTYSLWTLPGQHGTVEFIINRQHGQWGTDYDASQDLARVPMHVAAAAAPRDDFAIAIVGTGPGYGELRIAWDTFIWTVPITN